RLAGARPHPHTPRGVVMSQTDAPPLFHNAAAASLILGLVGMPSIAADPAFGLVFGAAAITCGVLGLRRARAGAWGRGSSIAGITLGAFVFAAWLISQDMMVP